MSLNFTVLYESFQEFFFCVKKPFTGDVLKYRSALMIIRLPV